MPSALFGILQLDQGEPLGYENFSGLLQAWLQDAGGFGMVGLIAYIIYAFTIPTNKSESERLRVPLSTWMVSMAGLALVCYAAVIGVFALMASRQPTLLGLPLGPPPIPQPPPGMPIKLDPPTWRTDWQSLLLMFGGLFALLGIGEPFARSMCKIFLRNILGVRKTESVDGPVGSAVLAAFVAITTFGLVSLAGLLDPEPIFRPGSTPFAITAAATVFVAGFVGLSGACRRAANKPQEYTTASLGVGLVTWAGAATAVVFVMGLAVQAAGRTDLLPYLAGGAWAVVGMFSLVSLVRSVRLATGGNRVRWNVFNSPIWAVAVLSFKEAVRSRMMWVFLIILLPFLFPAKWFMDIKPADELRTTVTVVSFFLMVLVLFPAILLSSFSGIPNDIKNQTIHTVVTKPVERFEVVLGRFLGYTFLMTLVLTGMTAFSLVLINSTKIDEKAEEETAKARVPLRGHLTFRSRHLDFQGTNVGREFDYRKYIAGHKDSPQRAIWDFTRIPEGLATAPGDRVTIEYTFDIFKLTKGEENKGVSTRFRFVTHNCPQRPPGANDPIGDWQWVDKARQGQYEARMRQMQARGLSPIGARPADKANWEAANQLAKEFGIFEYGGKEVFDYTVGSIEVPAGLFQNAREGDPGTERGPDGKPRPKPRFSAYVKCESGGQLLGMAEPDLYILEANQRFTVNFVKGAIGLWCRLCIIIGLAVAISTYLSSVLSLLVAAFVFVCGYATDHLNDVAYGRSIGGGPLESAYRLGRTEGPTTPLPESSGNWLIKWFDTFFGWVVRRFQNVIPDVESFTWTQFVSEGFNVNAEYLVINLLVTLGYLLPWGILAYYLMKSREVAS